MTVPIQFELAWLGDGPVASAAPQLLRKGDRLTCAPALTRVMPAVERAQYTWLEDRRGRLAEAVADDAATPAAGWWVRLDEWVATGQVQPPGPRPARVYVELPDLLPLTGEMYQLAEQSPIIWSYTSTNADDARLFSHWLRAHALGRGRFVLDTRDEIAGIARLCAALGRAILDGPLTEIAVAADSEISLRMYGRIVAEILTSLGRRGAGIRIISCPTCARCRVDLRAWVQQVESRLPATDEELELAVMGCEVNGPGEARSADVGLAVGAGMVSLFEDGEIRQRVPWPHAIDSLLRILERRLQKKNTANRKNELQVRS